MKVLHCINSPHIGGIERLVIELAIEQKANGIQVSIMMDSLKGQYYEYLLEQKIPLIESGIKGGFDMNFQTYKNLKAIFNTFDVIHLHNFSPIRSKAAIGSKAKTVYTIHGISKGIRKENRIKNKIREHLKKHYLNKVDVLVANSNYTLELARNHYGLKKIKSLTILNGIKLASELQGTKETPNDSFTIGLVSRFTPRKRIDRLIKAFDIFKKEGGNGHLILVGNGVTFQNINSQVKELNLEKDVDCLGYKTDVARYYETFDICIFPSQNEPFGLVAVEAYLHGKPVLAFNDSGGLKEVVAPLEPENIVKNEDELANRLMYFSKNKLLIAKNATKRKTYAKENFSIERMERDYYGIYKELV